MKYIILIICSSCSYSSAHLLRVNPKSHACNLPLLVVTDQVDLLNEVEAGSNYFNFMLNKPTLLYMGLVDKAEPIDRFVSITFGNINSFAHSDLFYNKIDGCTTGSFVMVDRSLINKPDKMQSALRHEFGHTLGLGHSELDTDLMYKELHPWDNLHPIDMSEDEIRLILENQ